MAVRVEMRMKMRMEGNAGVEETTSSQPRRLPLVSSSARSQSRAEMASPTSRTRPTTASGRVRV